MNNEVEVKMKPEVVEYLTQMREAAEGMLDFLNDEVLTPAPYFDNWTLHQKINLMVQVDCVDWPDEMYTTVLAKGALLRGEDPETFALKAYEMSGQEIWDAYRAIVAAEYYADPQNAHEQFAVVFLNDYSSLEDDT